MVLSMAQVALLDLALPDSPRSHSALGAWDLHTHFPQTSSLVPLCVISWTVPFLCCLLFFRTEFIALAGLKCLMWWKMTSNFSSRVLSYECVIPHQLLLSILSVCLENYFQVQI